MRITADRERCIGAAQCVLSDPDIFDQNEDDGRVELLVTDFDGDHLTAARQAVELCPARALSLMGSEHYA